MNKNIKIIVKYNDGAIEFTDIDMAFNEAQLLFEDGNNIEIFEVKIEN